MKSNSCKNRNDSAGQSIDIEWHVCPGGTSVHILHEPQELMSETRHEPESFPDSFIFASTSNDITDWENRTVQGKCLDSAKEVATYAAKCRPGFWCCCVPGSEKFITSKDPVFKCSKMMLQTAILISQRGKPGMHFESEPQNNLMLVNMVLACSLIVKMRLESRNSATSL